MRLNICAPVAALLIVSAACDPVESPGGQTDADVRDGNGDDDGGTIDGPPADADLTCTLCSTEATCVNTGGAWSCVCDDGYAGDGFTCEDIDECAAQNGGCLSNAECVNKPGTRVCRCFDGWVGDGETTCRTGLIFFANGASGSDRFFKSYDVASGVVTDETLMAEGTNDFCACGYYCWSPMVAGGALYYFANQGQRYTTYWMAVNYPESRRRGEYGAAVLDGKIYMVGGRTGPLAVQYYDAATMLWSALGEVPDYPWKIDWPAAAAIGNRVYVVAGHDGSEATGHMAYYEVGADAWTVLPDAPFTASRAYAVAAGGKLYVLAGGPMQVYDPTAGWASATITLPSGSSWRPAVVGDQVYLVGDVGADVRIMRLSGTSWTQVKTIPGVNVGSWGHVASTQ